jgi:hypothetical protein
MCQWQWLALRPSLTMSDIGDEGSNCSSAASVEKVGMLGWIGRGGVAEWHCLDARNLNLSEQSGSD